MNIKKNYLLYIIFAIVSILFIVFFVNTYVSFETLYDNYRFYAYHLGYINQINNIYDGFLYSLKSIINHLMQNQSSFCSVFLLSYIGIIFGKSRFIFICMLSVFYLLPLVFITFWLYKKTLNNYQNNNLLIQFVLLLFLLFNVFYWFPTLRGMPDIAALIPFIFLFYLVINSNFQTKLSFSKLFVLGVLFFIVFLFRRTFSTALFSLVLSIFLYTAFIIIYNYKNYYKKEILKQIYFLIKNLFIPIFIFFIFLKLFMPSFCEYFFSGRMIEECNLYLANTKGLLLDIFLYINPVFFIFLIIGVIQSFKNKEKQKISLISLLFVIVYIILFMNLQQLLFENFVPLSIILNLFILSGINYVLVIIKNNYAKILVSLVLSFYFVTNFILFFLYSGDQKYLNEIFSKPLLEDALPINPIDYDTFLNMYNYLYNEYKINKEYKFSSLTDARLFDPETMIYYSMVNNNETFAGNIENAVAPNTYGLSFNAYNCDYIVVSEPWGYQKENIFLPISLPTNDFINHTGISKYFEKKLEIQTHVPEYKIVIYKKVQPIPFAEMEELAHRFIEILPQYKELVEIQLIQFKDTYEETMDN